MALPSLLFAFFTGLASFLSPCILPIVPGFVSTLAGTVRRDPRHEAIQKVGIKSEDKNAVDRRCREARRDMFLATGHFVLGFCLTFALLGTLIACLCAAYNFTGLAIKHYMAWIGGFVILAFGVFLVLSTRFPRLNVQRQIGLGRLTKSKKANLSYAIAFVFGVTFAAGWTPCVGPLLGSVLADAVQSPAQSYNMLLAYGIGLACPFLIVSLFLADAQKLLRKVVKHTRYFDLVMGSLLIIIGTMFLVDQVVPLY
jgi:cytochrome c-type biogenesis protein